jgi:hypothetical protein
MNSHYLKPLLGSIVVILAVIGGFSGAVAAQQDCLDGCLDNPNNDKKGVMPGDNVQFPDSFFDEKPGVMPGDNVQFPDSFFDEKPGVMPGDNVQ